MIDGDIVIAWASSGQVTHRFCSSLAMTIAHLGRRCSGRIDAESGPLMASTRNNMVKSFLTGDFDGRPGQWLLFIDCDMEWEWEALERMLRIGTVEETPILGGLCFGGGRGGHIFPTLYACVRDDHGGLNLDRINDYPKDALVQIDATGAAFLLVHRSVFERMYDAFGVVRDDEGEVVLVDDRPVETPYPWFTYGANNGKSTGEDIAWCLRARACGIPVHVFTGARIGHVKTFVLDEATYEETRAAQAAEKATAKRVDAKVTPIHQGRVTIADRKKLRV